MATRSSVARCHTPLKTNIYLKPPQDSERRDSFEIGVFEASSYYASYVSESALADTKILDCVQEDEKEDHSMRRNSIKNTPVQCCDEREKPKKSSKKHKKQQPSSPSAKLASYLNSLFNQTRLSKPKRKPPLFEDDGRSSSMSIARYVDMVETASVHSCPTYSSSFTRPTPTSSHTRLQAHMTRLGYKDFRSYSSYSRKQSVMEADGERWPALTWFDQELNTRKRVSYNNVSKESNEVLREEKDDESAESDSSSDLFELQNDALQRRLGSRSGELPVHGTTNMMNNIKPRHVLNQ